MDPRTTQGPAFELAVQQQLFLLGYRNLRTTGWGQLLLGSLVMAGLSDLVPWHQRLAWLGVMLLIALAFWGMSRQFKAQSQATRPDPVALRRWLLQRRILQMVGGLTWGCLGLFLDPRAATDNLLIMVVFAGVMGYSTASNGAQDLWGYRLSGFFGSLAMVLLVPRGFDAHAPQIMLMFLLNMVVLLSIAGNTHRTLRSAIELRLENEALARSNAEQAARAEKANRDKSEFLAAASHDLRQPVHALLLLIEAYRHQVPAALDHPLMQQISQAGHAISSLFNALMELSRLEGHADERLAVAELDLDATLQDTVNHAQPEAQGLGLALRYRRARTLPPAVARTDPVLLRRVLGNLLSNALRYTHRGGVLLTLRRARGSDGVWIDVCDTGIGIAPGDQARIFDPYVQVANRERDRSRGLGLGLAIVKKACALLGIGVALCSVPGRGTRFRLHLPAAMLLQVDGHSAARSALPSAGSAVAAAPWLVGRRILMVDDDPMVRTAMRALLTGWQLEVRDAPRGDASVLDACAGGWVPECVLCDFRLPGGMDGIALLDWLQPHFPQAIGVLLTGEPLQMVQQQAEEAGYVLLSKPVDPALLALTLGALLERRAEERAA